MMFLAPYLLPADAIWSRDGTLTIAEIGQLGPQCHLLQSLMFV